MISQKLMFNFDINNQMANLRFCFLVGFIVIAYCQVDSIKSDQLSTMTLQSQQVQLNNQNNKGTLDTNEADIELRQDSQNQSSNQKPKEKYNIPGVGLSIVFLFGGLLYGSILKWISIKTSIPYNPMLLISGLALGIHYNSSHSFGILDESTYVISKLSPNSILAIFLPALIFESAFKTQWHVFKKMAYQSLTLGILSSIVCAVLLMIGIKLLFDSQMHYTWAECFLLGSILTCTDIFSFVSKLRRDGTPQKIASLIEGQSLFNYCTCVLIFQFFDYYITGTETVSKLEYIQLFFEQIFGGILFGVVFGFLSVFVIKRMIYDGVLVTTLMAISTYSIYLIAEFSFLRISGIISLVVYALYMNSFGKTWLFGETLQFVTNFWSYLVFVAETSIFLIAGVIVGTNILNLEQNIDNHRQYKMVVYIYILALIARFLSIATFIKYLRRFGDGMEWREVVVITFAGLKGAIGISLALMVYRNSKYDHMVGSLILLHVTGNSLLTLIINSLSTRVIVKFLGLSNLTKVQYKFYRQYLYSFQASILEKKQYLRTQKTGVEYEMVDWNQVQNQIGFDIFHKYIEQTDNIIKMNNFHEDSKFQQSQMYKLEIALQEFKPVKENDKEKIKPKQIEEKNAKFDLEVEFRKRFLKDLIAKYWKYHQANFTSPAALMLLLQSANSDLDKQIEQIQSWNWINHEITFNIKIYSELMKTTFINQLAKSHLFQYVSFCYDVVSSYIRANEEVREDLCEFYNKSSTDIRSQEEWDILMNVLRESEENQKEAEFFLINYLQPSFPQIEKEVKTRKVSFYLLHTFKNIIDHNYENGQLQPNEYDMLNQIIGKKSLDLNLSNPKWQEPNLFQILKTNQILAFLPDPILKILASEMGQQMTLDANQVIIGASQIAKYIYIVKKGGCIVEFVNQNVSYMEPKLAGNIFGYEALVTNIYHSKATANTMANVIKIKKTVFLKIFQTFPQAQQMFWKKHLFHCYKMFVKKDDMTFRLSVLGKEEVREMIHKFKLVKMDVGIMQNPQREMVFIRGGAEIVEKASCFEKTSRVTSMDQGTLQLHPFYFITRNDDEIIKIRQESYFLVGEADYDVFQKASVRLSSKYKVIKNLKSSVKQYQ